ncbi:polysaccharide deacetylase family protein [Bacteroides thetaiotaomicron]|uniref:polysaccharide deacetylase family protein n=1 Tax=Bacteroides thetaiotaomicron TaxID=818 RepID=UPI002165A994|nr:polysaccharide deacetylase family protein [Bacteroides thetaiotaomicron]MCS2466278.1 polysaccharide deacetylase family protein [Bacteroides thetaiotaomicron]
MGKSKICTLMYHDVYETSNQDSGFNIDSNYPYKLHISSFKEQICAIATYIRKYNIDKNYVQLSFDDGGISFYTIIMPILEEYGFKGYFYIATKYIGQNGFLTEVMIKEMAERGHYIGGHSHTHRQRMNDLSYEELKEDWSKCIEILSSIIGKPCIIASLPNGFTSKTIIRVLKELGVKKLYTSEPSEGLQISEYMEIRGRYGIRNTMSLDVVLAIIFDKKYKQKIRRKKVLLNVAKKLMGRNYIRIREYIFRHK